MSFLQGYARKLGVLDYKGTWNASTNTPALQSGQGNKGAYYIVSAAGSTDLDGTDDWGLKDWVVFNGSTWEKIDNSEQSQVVDTLSGYETNKAPSVASVKNYVNSQTVALSTTYVISSESEMLGLSASVGHLAVRLDQSKTYILKQTPASSLQNWQEITSLAGTVSSVAGKTGSVSLDTDDLDEASNLFFTEARAQAALASSLAQKANINSVVSSVAGKSGSVSLNTDDIAEASNLFFTNARAQSALTASLETKADKSFGFTYEIHVAKNGNNAGSTGKPYQPFSTIAAAVSYVETTFTGGESVVIYVHPGSYSESITITRPRTHLIGIQSTNAVIAEIGSVTLAPATVVGGVYNSSFSIENILLGAVSGSAAALTVAGTAECSLHLRNVYLYADDAGQKCLVITNTSANKSRLYFNDLIANNQLCSATALDFSNCVFQIKNTTVYSGTATCIKLSSTASGLAAFSLLETSGVLAIDVGATTFTLGSSTITASGSNASGVSVAAGGTYTTVQNFYNVASGTGYAITGAAGGVVTHAMNAFAYGTNNKYKNVLYLVAHPTTMTAST